MFVITVGYHDKAVLFYLGARELRSTDEMNFFQAASQAAYKLSVPVPDLYFYNGSIERAFVLQNRDTISLIINRELLTHSSHAELHAICFELLLQVKKGMAGKRTRVLFMLGTISWFAHSLTAVLVRFFSMKEIRHAINWFVVYLLYPCLKLLYWVALGESYFRKLQTQLNEFPVEAKLFQKLGLRLRKPIEIHSLASRKFIELTAVTKSTHYQNILALEFLPHEWDYLFNQQDLERA